MRGPSYTIDPPKAEEFSQTWADVTNLIVKMYHMLPQIPNDKENSSILEW